MGNDLPQTSEINSDSKSRATGSPTLKHVLFALSVPLVVLLAGILLLSATALVGLILVIVAIALSVGILMAALRIKHQKRLATEPAQWKTRTLPLTSLVLIVGVATLLFFVFSH